MKNLLFTIAILLFGFQLSIGQSAKKQDVINKALSAETIENQFTILIENSPRFQNFKNIKDVNLNKFTKNFKDSLIATSKKFSDAYLKIQTQKNEIEKLNDTINKKNTDLATISSEKNSINFFGIQISKALYNTILWSMILGLLASTFLFLYKFKNSNSTTKHAQLTLNEIETDFETHKKNSLEREQVLRRKLQDEINKQRNVK